MELNTLNLRPRLIIHLLEKRKKSNKLEYLNSNLSLVICYLLANIDFWFYWTFSICNASLTLHRDLMKPELYNTKGVFGDSVQFSSVQSLSRVRLFATPWTIACQASLSITNSWSVFKLMSIESVMPSKHLTMKKPFSLFNFLEVFV